MIVQKIVTSGAILSAVFDGSNDSLLKASDLTGAANGKQITFAAWIRPAAAQVCNILGMGGTTFRLTDGAQSTFIAASTDFTLGAAFSVASTQALTTGSWFHLAISLDLTDSGKRHVFINGAAASGVTWDSFNNVNMDLTPGAVGVCCNNSGQSLFNGRVMHVWHHPTYLALTTESVIRKFVNAAGKPANMGGQGQNVTGSQPLLYMRDFADFKAGRNRGSGGNFTLTGTLTAAAGP